MIIDGVTFVEEECKKMSEEEFKTQMGKVFWQDRDEETREKMLADAYSRIKGTGNKRPRKK